MSKSLLRLMILSAPLVLTACGEGWEVQKTTGYAPYGNSRTAGSGVVYVRARMLPKKELVAEPVMEEIKAESEETFVEDVTPMEEPAPVLEAEEIFTEAQQKGVSHSKVSEESSAVEDEGVEAKPEEESAAVEGDSQEEVESASDNEILTPMPEDYEKGEASDEEKHSGLMLDEDSKQASAEDYISQVPKTIVAPKVKVIRVNSYEPSSGGQEEMKTADINDYDIEGEIIEVYENEVVQPRKQIIVPKKDPGSYLSVGEEELHEIYNQPF